MNKALLGIDLGTSSIKVLLYHENGQIEKVRVAYEEISPRGWLGAMEKALRALDLSRVGAVGLSAQTGTYVINGKDVINWSEPAGKEEVDILRSKIPKETFLEEIGMPHPAIASYPLPRLCYIKKHIDGVHTVCQPKDLMLAYLTGVYKSDIWTWRGLAHPERKTYSRELLQALGLDPAWLPPLCDAETVVGVITDAVASQTGLPVGTPVVAGLNDFFAGLAGMGVPTLSPLFDITGTSEHFGIIENAITLETGMVSGKFLQGFVHYGGTASGGISLSFGMKELGAVRGELADFLAKKPPIFLPYLNGERAPIFDPHARGVFFGLGKDCTKADLSYAVSEGVAFSVYHIAKHLVALPVGDVLLGGGAAKDPLLGTVKATLFNRSFITLREADTSALGAAMIAGIGTACFHDLSEATESCIQMDQAYTPIPALRDTLLKRYAIYEQLYTALRPQFQAFKEI